MAIELKQALHKASKLERYMDPSLAEEYSGCEEYQTVPLAVMEPIVTAAESWQGLQWRQPGDAPVDMIVAERAWEERGDRFEPQPSYNSEDPRLRMFYDVTWEIPGLEVDDTAGARGYRHWQDVLKWVAENEWTTPIMTIAEVARKYGLD